MSHGRLWAGWRNAYVGGLVDASTSPGSEAHAEECVFCRITAAEADEDPRAAGLVWRGSRTAVVLNAYPYTSGHVMVLPLRHVGELEQLDVRESAELWDSVVSAVQAIKAAYSPGGLNIGVNLGRAGGAGLPGHLHVHVLPRWEGDTNFMTSVAEVRVLPEALGDSWAKLRAVWPG